MTQKLQAKLMPYQSSKSFSIINNHLTIVSEIITLVSGSNTSVVMVTIQSYYSFHSVIISFHYRTKAKLKEEIMYSAVQLGHQHHWVLCDVLTRPSSQQYVCALPWFLRAALSPSQLGGEVLFISILLAASWGRDKVKGSASVLALVSNA